MTEKPTFSTRLSIALNGKLLQFNISLLVLSILILGIFFVSARSTVPLVVYGGSGVALVSFLMLMAFVIIFYGKQKSRPLDGQAVAISMKNEVGREVSIRNPPDSFFEKGELNALARSMLVGYDESMCPDGEVIGKASEGNYRRYTAEEKAEFIKLHKAEIKGKRAQIATLLAQDGANETNAASANAQVKD